MNLIKLCIFKQQPQKTHEQDIIHVPKSLQFIYHSLYPIGRISFIILGMLMHQGHRTRRQQNHGLSGYHSGGLSRLSIALGSSSGHHNLTGTCTSPIFISVLQQTSLICSCFLRVEDHNENHPLTGN